MPGNPAKQIRHVAARAPAVLTPGTGWPLPLAAAAAAAVKAHAATA